MFHPKSSGITGLASLLLGLAAPPAIAQAEAQPQMPAAGDAETIEGRRVHLEVLVTDRQGQRVTDLTVEDFEVLDDGDRVEISYFAPPPGPQARDRIGPAETPPPASAPSASGPAETPLLVFYFDGLHLTREGRQPVLDALERFLWDQRAAPERIMVLNQSEGIRMLASFGSTTDFLAQAITDAADAVTSGQLHEAERGEMISAVFSESDPRQAVRRQSRPAGASVQVCERLESGWREKLRTFAQAAGSRGATSLGHLRSLTDLLGALPGSKVLVYVSGGLEIEPAVDVARYIGRHCRGLHRMISQTTQPSSLDRTFKNLVLDASAHRITFYTLEAGGVGPGSRGLAETGGRDVSPAERRLLRSDNPQTGLTFLAEETGGRAVLETMRFDGPLITLAEDLGAFYSLAYSPPAEPDRRERQVKVEVRDPRKLQLRYRRSYRNVAAGKTLADRLITALNFGWSDNPLGAEIGYGSVSPHPENAATYLVPLRFTLPLDRLQRLEEEGGSRARLRFMLAARDQGDRVLGPLQRYYDIALPGGEESLGDQTFEFITEMTPGRQDLALGFVDEHSGVASFLIESLALPQR